MCIRDRQKINEGSISSENLKTEVAKLKELISSKDAAMSQANSAKRSFEVELEECKSRLEETKKQFEALKKKGSGRDASGADEWRVSNSHGHRSEE